MANRRASRNLEVRLTSDIRRRDDFGPAALERIELVVAQLFREYRLSDRIRARRATTHVRIGDGGQRESETLQDAFDRPSQLLSVLQRAGAMKGHLLASGRAKNTKRLARGGIPQGARACAVCSVSLSPQ